MGYLRYQYVGINPGSEDTVDIVEGSNDVDVALHNPLLLLRCLHNGAQGWELNPPEVT